jgi:NAD(P)H-hydrate epimerase
MTQVPWLDKDVPFITAADMVTVDRFMIDTYGIELIQMMENAGRNLAYLSSRRFFATDPRGRHITVLAGTGGNGGGVMVAARRLHNHGAKVCVVTTREAAAYAGVPGHQLEILRRMSIPIMPAEAIDACPPADLVLDGIIGYSLRGAPRGAAAALVAWANQQPVSTLSLDVPSGVDAGAGTVYEPAVRATATMTLALPKAGFRNPGVSAYVGELYLADISVPPSLYARPPLGLTVGPLFAAADVVRLRYP